jgi:hypothetical protein
MKTAQGLILFRNFFRRTIGDEGLAEGFGCSGHSSPPLWLDLDLDPDSESLATSTSTAVDNSVRTTQT